MAKCPACHTKVRKPQKTMWKPARGQAKLLKLGLFCCPNCQKKWYAVLERRRGSDPIKYEKANEMRRDPTPAEARMWEILKSQVMPNFPGHIFYRQMVAYGYILDFYCPTLRLGLEIDGGIHDNQKRYDRQRDTNLARRGIKVVRARNEVVFNRPEALARQLCQIIKDKTTPWYRKIFSRKG